jgi:hypothetical protein
VKLAELSEGLSKRDEHALKAHDWMVSHGGSVTSVSHAGDDNIYFTHNRIDLRFTDHKIFRIPSKIKFNTPQLSAWNATIQNFKWISKHLTDPTAGLIFYKCKITSFDGIEDARLNSLNFETTTAGGNYLPNSDWGKLKKCMIKNGGKGRMFVNLGDIQIQGIDSTHITAHRKKLQGFLDDSKTLFEFQNMLIDEDMESYF